MLDKIKRFFAERPLLTTPLVVVILAYLISRVVVYQEWWSTSFGGDKYMTLLHCARHDMIVIYTIIISCCWIVIRYACIAIYNIRAALRSQDVISRRYNISFAALFMFCGIGGYAFTVIRIWWSSYKLLAIILLLIGISTELFWRYIKKSGVLLKILERSESLNNSLKASETDYIAKVESERDELRNQLIAIVSKSAKPEMLVDYTGTILAVSKPFAEALGHHQSYYIGRDFQTELRPKHWEKTSSEFRARKDQEGESALVNDYRHADGSYREVRWTDSGYSNDKSNYVWSQCEVMKEVVK